MKDEFPPKPEIFP